MPRDKAIKRRAAALWGTALAGVMLTGMPATAFAQDATERGATQERAFDVPSGPLASALLRLGAQAGVQFNIDSRLTEGRTTPGLQGRYTVERALTTLLAGSGLTYRFAGPQTIVIEALPETGDARVLGALRVEGAGSSGRNGSVGATDVSGVNGSNDVTATEGTGSYTTGGTSVASKEPRSLKDTPQSVSVITSAQIDEQNLNSFPDVMAQMPGVSVVTRDGGALRQEFYSRGLLVQRAQIDGGAPIDITGSRQGVNPQFDTAVYDHVEILRGADGLFNGYGDPGGVVSLQRKRPLDRRQFVVDGQVGSWQNYRASVDVTGPVALDGRLRARGVAVWQDRQFFYDTANNEKGLLFGSLDFDVTPSTLVNAGISRTWLRGTNFDSGLPRFADGADIGLPRDRCLCFPDSRFSIGTTELFARVEQEIGSSWNLKANVTHLNQDIDARSGTVAGAVIPATRTGPALTHTLTKLGNTQTTVDFTLNGSFRLFGHDQRLVIGGNHSIADGGGAVTYAALDGRSIPVDIFNFNPSDHRYRRTGTFVPSIRRLEDVNSQYGAYATLDLTIWDPLHVAVGLRYSKRTTRSVSEFVCERTAGCRINTGELIGFGNVTATTRSENSTDDFVWPPNASARLDLTKSLSVYGSYSRIFGDQSTFVDVQRRPLSPFYGNNVEAGVKWSPNEGRTNMSVAVYRIKQRNVGIFAQLDPTFPLTGPTRCCYVASPDYYRLSEGIDAEASGEIFAGLQVAASYTYNRNENVGNAFFSEGEPLQSRFPAHLYKLWLSYQSRRTDWLGRLNIGAGVTGQSSTFVSGVVCPSVNPVTGGCLVRRQPFQFTEAGYAIASARIGYRVNDVLQVAVNANNLFDKRYYQTVGVSGSGNFYGEPRNVLLSLTGTF